jgi:hypothetical protein
MIYLSHKDGEGPRKEGKKMNLAQANELYQAANPNGYDGKHIDSLVYVGRGKVVHMHVGYETMKNHSFHVLCGAGQSTTMRRPSWTTIVRETEVPDSTVCSTCLRIASGSQEMGA